MLETRDKSLDPKIPKFASPLTQQEPLNVNKEGEIGVLEELPDSRLKANISPITAMSNPRISRQQRKQLSQNLSNNNGSALGSRSITDHSPMVVEQGNTGGKLLPESKVSSSLSTQMSDFKSKLTAQIAQYKEKIKDQELIIAQLRLENERLKRTRP